jgi:26S proteasome regulatory subunit N9
MVLFLLRFHRHIYMPPTSTNFACSLKLIRGSLDQVDQKAQITWVQPRVLSREQIGALAKRLESWCDKLTGVEGRITPQLLVNA